MAHPPIEVFLSDHTAIMWADCRDIGKRVLFRSSPEDEPQLLYGCDMASMEGNKSLRVERRSNDQMSAGSK